MALNYQELYDLTEDFGAEHAFRAEIVDDDLAIDDFALLVGNVIPEALIPFKRHQGRYLNDLIWTTGYTVLVSGRIVTLLRDGGFTGWNTYPIELHDKRGEAMPGYHGFSVAGRCGPINHSRSRKAWRGPLVPKGRKFEVYCGMFFEDDQWDGSDIFLPRTSAFIIVAERLKQALEEMKIRNVRFERLTTLELSVDD